MKNVTRRSALGLFVAAGGATLLAACGAQPQATSGNASERASSNASGSASASASKSVRSDYSGVAVLDGYTSKPAGYKEGTRTEPPKNVPVPVKPAVANENSVEGFYQSIAFFGAASEYYGRTGKTEPLRESGIDISELKTTLEPTPGSFDDALQKGEVWRQEQTVTVAMNTPQPTRDGDSYIWNVKMVLENGEFAVYKGKVMESPKEYRKITGDAIIRGVYENGDWKLTVNPVATSSATASASAS